MLFRGMVAFNRQGISFEHLGAVRHSLSEPNRMDGRLFPSLEVIRNVVVCSSLKLSVDGDLCRMIRESSDNTLCLHNLTLMIDQREACL